MQEDGKDLLGPLSRKTRSLLHIDLHLCASSTASPPSSGSRPGYILLTVCACWRPALAKCFRTLPVALVGRGDHWAAATRGSLKPERPLERQKACSTCVCKGEREGEERGRIHLRYCLVRCGNKGSCWGQWALGCK
jgi:hypothetical protein